jgi:energy-coupling factor transporter ATP-binding protein EcfA2
MEPKMDMYKLEAIASKTTVAIIGRRGSGKTTLTKKILEFTKGNVLIFTEHGDTYANFEPGRSVTVYDLDPKKIELNVFKAQSKDNSQPLVVVLDDWIHEEGKLREVVCKILMNAKALNLTIILNLPYILGLHPALMDNIRVFFLIGGIDRGMEYIIEDPPEQYDAVLKDIYTSVVRDTRRPRREVYYYKVPYQE